MKSAPSLTIGTLRPDHPREGLRLTGGKQGCGDGLWAARP